MSRIMSGGPRPKVHRIFRVSVAAPGVADKRPRYRSAATPSGAGRHRDTRPSPWRSVGEAGGDLALGHRRPILDALSSTRWIVLRSPPKVPVPGETSLARIQSQPLRARFARALATMSSVSAAKPTTRPAGRWRAAAMRGEDVGVLGQAQHRRAAAVLLELVRRPRSRPANRRPPPPDRDIGRQRRLAGRQHLAPRSRPAPA